MRFMYANQWDESSYTVSSNSEETDYPASNLREYQLARHYRATGDTSEWVKIDGGSSEAITASIAFIAGHNITSGATTIKIQGNDTDSWGSPTVDQSFTHDAGVMWKAFTEDSLRYWRFLVEDASNPDTYIKMGRVGLGTYLDMTNWPKAQFPRRTVDTSTIRRSPTGQLYGDKRITYKEYEFDFPIITDTERQNLETMWEAVQKVKPILFIADPSGTTIDPLYCTISEFELTALVGFQWQARMVLTEAL